MTLKMTPRPLRVASAMTTVDPQDPSGTLPPLQDWSRIQTVCWCCAIRTYLVPASGTSRFNNDKISTPGTVCSCDYEKSQPCNPFAKPPNHRGNHCLIQLFALSRHFTALSCPASRACQRVPERARAGLVTLTSAGTLTRTTGDGCSHTAGSFECSFAEANLGSAVNNRCRSCSSSSSGDRHAAH